MNVPEEWARARLSPRSVAVLMVLCDASETLSTAEVRERVNRGRKRALVAEQVYRTLVTLAQSGHVRRMRVAGSRDAFWQATSELEREEVG